MRTENLAITGPATAEKGNSIYLALDKQTHHYTGKEEDETGDLQRKNGDGHSCYRDAATKPLQRTRGESVTQNGAIQVNLLHNRLRGQRSPGSSTSRYRHSPAVKSMSRNQHSWRRCDQRRQARLEWRRGRCSASRYL